MKTICFKLPVEAYSFHEEEPKQSSKNTAPLGEQVEALKISNPKLHSAIFGHGVITGKKQVTDQHLDNVQDERYTKTREALVRERVQRKIRALAKEIGAIDCEDFVDLLSHKFDLGKDLQVIKVGDAPDAEEIDLADAVSKFGLSRPHLIKSKQIPGTGGRGQTPIPTKEKKTFKRSQLRDAAFYAKYEKEILLAQKEGRIIDDIEII